VKIKYKLINELWCVSRIANTVNGQNWKSKCMEDNNVFFSIMKRNRRTSKKEQRFFFLQ
jgi:hypothetical protein